MSGNLRDVFLARWAKDFPGAALPIGYWFTEHPDPATVVAPPKGWRCLVGDLARVRRGQTMTFTGETIGCGGGQHFAGFTPGIRPNFEYFLSCGIPGEMEGERYKKTPDLVKRVFAKEPTFTAPAPYLTFKRWDHLEAGDEPLAAVFFATPDVLSGLFTLANFDEEDAAVIAPFGAACTSLVRRVLVEAKSERPRAVLGMFDVSARPYVGENELTLAVPMAKFARMVADMDESFLITDSWRKVMRRLARE